MKIKKVDNTLSESLNNTPTFDPSILKAYDIRGKFDHNLHAVDAYYLGRALAHIINEKGLDKTIYIARDGRISSPILHQYLIKGLLDSNCQIVDIGIVATPMLYYASAIYNPTMAIMITGSHNPADENGFKIVFENKPFYGDQIQEIAKIVVQELVIDNNYESFKNLDIKNDYVNSLINNAYKIHYSTDMKIAWDTGNGSAGEVIELLMGKIKAEHFAIYTKIDGRFLNHHPDPSDDKNLDCLIKLVLKKQCTIGFAFDGDGDRLGVIDDFGKIFSNDKILFLLAKDLLLRNPGAKIVIDIKMSNWVINEIEKIGGICIICRSGHSFIKAKMLEESAMLAAEMSGHFYFKENYFGFDDALFAACKLLAILNEMNTKLSNITNQLPKVYFRELKFEIDDANKINYINAIKSHLNKFQINFSDIDGIKVKEVDNCWLVRTSNTQSIVMIIIESNLFERCEETLNKVLNLLKDLNKTYALKEIN